jgi:hypothetical protein
MLRPGGYIVIADPDPRRGTPGTIEKDTFSCPHCNRIVDVRPFASASESGGWCGRCAKPICPECAKSGACIPLEKQLLAMEARGRLLAQIEGLA